MQHRAERTAVREAQQHSACQKGLLSLPPELLEQIFKLIVHKNGWHIRVDSDRGRVYYYRESYPNHEERWLQYWAQTEAGELPDPTLMEYYDASNSEASLAGNRLSVHEDVLFVPLRHERMTALLATCSRIRDVWGGLAFEANAWRVDDAALLATVFRDIGPRGCRTLRDLTIVVLTRGGAHCLQEVQACRELRRLTIMLPHAVWDRTLGFRPWRGLRWLPHLCVLPELRSYVVRCCDLKCSSSLSCRNFARPCEYNRWSEGP